ncbi:MAG: hypothetical protein GY838_18105 [bacterium]|nr:hypothetical protein [bacterium]
MHPSRSLTRVLVACLAVAVLTACDSAQDLHLDDLAPGEFTYVSRIVVLERAKAVALDDRPTGEALLDSLAAAWGDSSLAETAAGVPDDPARAAAVGRLLERILTAELDSLVLAPRPDRLGAPLPDPELPTPESAAE